MGKELAVKAKDAGTHTSCMEHRSLVSMDGYRFESLMRPEDSRLKLNLFVGEVS